MYTRCPNCHFIQNISVEQFRVNCGLAQCPACSGHYKIILSLTDQTEYIRPKLNATGYYGSPERKRERSVFWSLATLLALFVLCGQVIYFEGGALIQQPPVRQSLQFLCSRVGCTLPAYHNLAEWSVSHSDLQASAENRYLLTALITNQADLPQALPKLKLQLLDYQGRIVAERIFTGSDYAAAEELPGNETLGVSLAVVPPAVSGKIGGYSIVLQ